MSRNNSFNIKQFQDIQIPNNHIQSHIPQKQQKTKHKSVRDQLLEQNNILKRKYIMLNQRLEVEKKNLQQKTKNGGVPNYIKQALSSQNQSIQLQNAHRTIERLLKSVHNYQNNQSFQLTYKKINQLQSVIKEKTSIIDELKTQLKFLNKGIKSKSKHIEDLQEQKIVIPNNQQQKQQIQRLKLKLKKLTAANKQLIKKQMQKHSKLIDVEQRIMAKQQQQQYPTMSKQDELKQQIQQYQKKINEAQMRVQKQKTYISKLKNKMSGNSIQAQKKKIQKIVQSKTPVIKYKSVQSKQKESQIQEIIQIQNTSRSHRKSTQKDARMRRQWNSVADINQINHKEDIKEFLISNVPSKKLPNRLFRRF